MKTTFIGVVLFVVVSTGIIAAAENKIPELREWTSVGGTKIEARFVTEQGVIVVLEREDGKRIRIGKQRLIFRDQLWIEENHPETVAVVEEKTVAKKSDTAVVQEEADILTVLDDDKWDDCHAVYEHREFDAVVDSDGGMRLYMKKNGNRVDAAPFSLKLSCKYEGSSSRSAYRNISSFSAVGQPVRQPDALKLTGKLDENVDFELNYEFSKNKISIWGRCIDPPDIKDATVFRLQFIVPRAYDIPLQMPMDEQEKLLNGNKFILSPIEGKNITCTYIKRESLKRHVKSIMISGPLYGGRKIKIVAGDPRTTPLSPYVSPIGAPWEGYSVSMTKEDAASTKSKEKMIITVM